MTLLELWHKIDVVQYIPPSSWDHRLEQNIPLISYTGTQ